MDATERKLDSVRASLWKLVALLAGTSGSTALLMKIVGAAS